MRRPSILLVNLPTLPLNHLRTCTTCEGQVPHTLAMPMGLLYISAYLRAHCDVREVGLLDFNASLPDLARHKTVEDFILAEIRRQAGSAPDIVGISLLFTASHPFFELAVSRIRAAWPKALIVVGGNHATNCARLLLRNESIDYLVRGEGEVAFAQLVAQYARGEKIGARGVYASSAAAIASDNELVLADRLSSLDELPFPDWSLLDMERYCTSSGRRRSLGEAAAKRLATIQTSRGCPFRCTYCAAHTVHGRSVRFRSIDKVVDEVLELHERHGVTLFVPEDDLFTANKGRTLELLRRLRDLGIPGFELQFPDGLSVNQLDGDILDAMARCGAQTVNLALESGSEYVQSHIIKKKVDLKKARELVRMCRDRGLLARCFVILGFPGETKAMMDETARYLRELQADWCVLMIATPLVGSEMYEQFLEAGYIRGDIDELAQLLFRDRNFDTKEITAVELKEFVNRLNLDLNFVNNSNLSLGRYDTAIAQFKDILQTYPFHVFALYGMHVAYQRKGDMQQAESVREQIKSLLKSSESARAMYQDYQDLLPKEFVASIDSTI